MADDKTQTLGSGGPDLEARLMARFDALDARLSELEQKAEDKSRDTRPLLTQAIKEMQEARAELGNRLSAIEKELRTLGRKIGVFGEDLLRARVEVRDLDARVTSIEQKPA